MYGQQYGFLFPQRRSRGAAGCAGDCPITACIPLSATTPPSIPAGAAMHLAKTGGAVGTIGEIHPLVLQNYGINTKVYAAKLDASALFDLRVRIARNISRLPKYPADCPGYCGAL